LRKLPTAHCTLITARRAWAKGTQGFTTRRYGGRGGGQEPRTTRKFTKTLLPERFNRERRERRKKVGRVFPKPPQRYPTQRRKKVGRVSPQTAAKISHAETRRRRGGEGAASCGIETTHCTLLTGTACRAMGECPHEPLLRSNLKWTEWTGWTNPESRVPSQNRSFDSIDSIGSSLTQAHHVSTSPQPSRKPTCLTAIAACCAFPSLPPRLPSSAFSASPRC
jgi:hypothetical protein